MSITITKVARHYQVTVPREIRERYRLKEGDMVSFEVRNGEIVMSPICIVKKDQSYFFSERWQKAIKKSEEEIKRGHYMTYHSGEELERDIEK